MQNLQPVGTVEWSDNVGGSWQVANDVNQSMGETIIANVSYGEDYIVYPNEDGDWVFVAELNDEGNYFYDRTDELADGQDDYFVVNVPDERERYLFIKREDWE